MAPARSFWKGHLRLALVTIPIRLVSASASETKIALHQVDRKSHQRIRYQKTAGEGGRVVTQDDIVQGYKTEDGSYVLFEPDELENLKLSTRHQIELVQFVDADAISPQYFETPYYILPDGDVAEEGYRVIRDALQSSGKCGIGQLTMRGRENLVSLHAYGEGLLLETLRYQEELRDPAEIFEPIGKGKLKPDLVNMAKQLIAERTEAFNAAKFQNHYAEALRDLVKAKLKGGKSVEVGESTDAAPSSKVIDFMEALKRSTSAKATAEKPAPKSKSRSKVAAVATHDNVKRGAATPAKKTRKRG